MKYRRILIALTSHDRNGSIGDNTAAAGGFYLSEASHPALVFQAAGYTVDFVSPAGGKTHVDGFDLSDSDNATFWNDPVLRLKTEQTLSPRSVRAQDYCAIFYAGGHATMWDFPESEALGKIASEIYASGGVVAAVCHGPAGLLCVKDSVGQPLVRGKSVAAFTNEEEKAVGMFETIPFSLSEALVAQGATHLPAENFEKQVVVSERLVTGQNPASARGVAEAVVETLAKLA